MSSDKMTLIMILFLVHSARSFNQHTTTRSYSLDVPDSDPIKIIESEPLWEKLPPIARNSKQEQRSFTISPSHTNLNNPLGPEEDESTSEFSSNSLKDFLDGYAEKIKEKYGDAEKISMSEDEEKDPKRWSMMDNEKYNNPYEDKKGWVSLEPVPWSVSKISKWKPKPTERPAWGGNDPWENDFDDIDRPQHAYKGQSEKKYQVNVDMNLPYPAHSPNMYEYKPESGDKYHDYPEPAAMYTQNVHVKATPNRPVKVSSHKHGNKCKHEDVEDIITDGQPPNFPKRYPESNRRLSTEEEPQIHPFMGEGEWVLLSTTKGYKSSSKHRPRSLDFAPEAMSTHKTVHLTVLPPLKGSKVNMTTSHGGLLQVESTFETVEQAQKKYQKQRKLKPRRKRPTQVKKPIKKKPPVKAATQSTIATVSRRADSSAMLAGVGAGLIPATMAMMVPMVLNGRRRRRRDVHSRSRTV